MLKRLIFSLLASALLWALAPPSSLTIHPKAGEGAEPPVLSSPLLGQKPAFGEAPAGRDDTISIKYKEGMEEVSVDELRDQSGAKLQRRNPSTNVETLTVPGHLRARDLVEQLARDPRVEWVEQTQWRRAALAPNDAEYENSQKWYYDLILAPDAWGSETGKSSTVIAIIDSGMLCTHPDLLANVWTNTREIPANGLDDDGNGYTDDVNGYDFVGADTGAVDQPGDGDPCLKVGDPALGNGVDEDADGIADDRVNHGTFVAGVAAATTNNALGVSGMCWQCRVMPVRVMGPEGRARSSDIADGVTYAARNGAKIINISLASPSSSQAEIAAINAAVNTYGALVVVAAGNDNHNPVSYPAQLPTVLAVGSSARSNTKGRALFSNWGTGEANNRLVDVVAPGVDIASTTVVSVAEGQSGSRPAGTAHYTLKRPGTSFSAPLVAGLAGLMVSRNPALTPAQMIRILKETATPLEDDPSDSPNAGSCWAGSGMVNAAAVLTAAGQAIPPVPPPTIGAPQLTGPACGTLLPGLGTTVNWTTPAGATQIQIRIQPANNDGPDINLIRNASSSYTIQPPVFGAGPYVMLPGMTYTWKVRAHSQTTGIDENSSLWGPWSLESKFRTKSVTSAGVSSVAPANGTTVSSLTPLLQWANTDNSVFYYEVQASKDINFGEAGPLAMVYSELRHGDLPGAPKNSYQVPSTAPMEANTTYFWRVRPRIQGDGTPTAWSQTFSFKTPGESSVMAQLP